MLTALPWKRRRHPRGIVHVVELFAITNIAGAFGLHMTSEPAGQRHAIRNRHTRNSGKGVTGRGCLCPVVLIGNVVPPKLQAQFTVAGFQSGTQIQHAITGHLELWAQREHRESRAAIGAGRTDESAKSAGYRKSVLRIAHTIPLGCVRERLTRNVKRPEYTIDDRGLPGYGINWRPVDS